MNFKLFLGCIHDPQSNLPLSKKNFGYCLIFERRLNRCFWRSKKVVKVVQIGGRGVEVIWKKSKRTAVFFRETFPKMHTKGVQKENEGDDNEPVEKNHHPLDFRIIRFKPDYKIFFLQFFYDCITK